MMYKKFKHTAVGELTWLVLEYCLNVGKYCPEGGNISAANTIYNCKNTYPISKQSTELYMTRAKNFNSLQSYVRAIWVKTRKQQKWFWGDINAYVNL